MSLDFKTLALVVMTIVGVGGGATGITTGLGGSDKIDELTKEVRDLRIVVEKRSDSDEIYRSRIDDHEKRIRALERKSDDE